MKQLTLFPAPRKARRKLMHMTDAGFNPSGPGEIATFECPRCQHKTGWIRATPRDIRKGIPCPACES